jgi:sterol desaturase/sphingolipid hydroxylase (fatty acid hydroxylase superfamily)
LSSAILYLVAGLGPAAAAGGVLLSGLAELVYHWNIRTPYWLGFLFQRPESHCIHHEKGVHSFNYSDLPLWDMLFGTFRNPREWNAQCGFEPAQELRFGEMLIGRDVHAPVRGDLQP